MIVKIFCKLQIKGEDISKQLQLYFTVYLSGENPSLSYIYLEESPITQLTLKLGDAHMYVSHVCIHRGLTEKSHLTNIALKWSNVCNE